MPRGGNPERLAAISQGVAHFTHMPEPFVREAERLNLKDSNIDCDNRPILFGVNAEGCCLMDIRMGPLRLQYRVRSLCFSSEIFFDTMAVSNELG